MRATLPIAIDNRIAEGEEPFNCDVAETKVQDPFNLGRNVTASIALRDDPLASMFAKGGLEVWQFAAGRKLQEVFERVEAGRLKAFDPSAIHVSGALGADFLKYSHHETLKAVEDATGVRDPKTGISGFETLRAVLSHRQTISTVADNAVVSRKVVTRIFKQALSTAGEVLGLKGRAQAKVNNWSTEK